MTKNNRKGFTIIEVVLVLAIAGLIFLMVFIALPALQRSQRNTRRRQDMARIITAITDYTSNNNRMPWVYNGAGGWSDKKTDVLVKSYIIGDNSYSYSDTTGATKDGQCSDQFCDPDGTSYRFFYYYNKAYANGSLPTDKGKEHAIMVVENSMCSGNESDPIKDFTGDKMFSVLYGLEGGAIYCGDNQ